MVPEGYDSVIFTTTEPKIIFLRVLEQLSHRWPIMRGFLTPEHLEFVGMPQIAPAFFTEDGGSIYLYRDEEMDKHTEETGGTLMPDGEGTIDIHFVVKEPLMFNITVDKENEETGYAPRFPYPAYLLSPRLYEITICTPEDPALDLFSGWVFHLVKSACLQSDINEED